MTYAECRICIEHVAGRIADTLCVAPPNAFVGLLLDNSPEWVVAFWAILQAGFRPLLLNPRQDDAQNLRLMQNARAVALAAKRPLGDAVFLDSADMARPPIVRTAFAPRWANGIALCSSGTSGLPKLCVFDGRAVSAQILNSGHVLSHNNTINTRDHGRLKLLAFLPFCHVFGLIADLLWFGFFGCTFVLLRDLSPDTIQDACRRHGVTHVFAIPLLFAMTAQAVRQQAASSGQAERLERALSLSLFLQNVFPRAGAALVRRVLFRRVRERVLGTSVRFCITGGGFVSEDTLRVLSGLGYALYNGFGMTEVGISSVELGLRARDRLCGSVGTPLPSAEYRLEDGELLVRGPSLFSAFVENGVEIPREPDAWYHTGDLAHRGRDGRYYIDGRRDDLIVTDGGENLSPDALEDRYLVPHVKRLCLIGLRGSDAHTAITLVAQLEDGISELQHNRAVRELFSVNASLPAGSRAEQVLLADEPLPASLGCKVRRSEVRQGLLNGTFRCHKARPDAVCPQVALSADYDRVLREMLVIFAEVLGKPMDEITPASHLIYDLGCGSMQYFALLSRIGDAYRVTMNLDAGMSLATPEEFAAYIVKKG